MELNWVDDLFVTVPKKTCVLSNPEQEKQGMF